MKPVSVHQHFRTLKSFLGWAVDVGFLTGSPMQGIEMRIPKALPMVPEDDHVRLTSGGHRAMLLWVLTANAGARRFYESLGGHVGREQFIEIGGAQYSETAYGWDDLPELLQRLGRAAGRPG